jgi:selenide,water dikinase
MNATATSALALCVIPYGLEQKTEAELLHMLAGCVTVLNREGCVLVGGHTSEGAEPALGLSGTDAYKKRIIKFVMTVRIII